MLRADYSRVPRKCRGDQYIRCRLKQAQKQLGNEEQWSHMQGGSAPWFYFEFTLWHYLLGCSPQWEANLPRCPSSHLPLPFGMEGQKGKAGPNLHWPTMIWNNVLIQYGMEVERLGLFTSWLMTSQRSTAYSSLSCNIAFLQPVA